MKNLKISTRLSGAFALLVLMLVGLAVAAMTQLSAMRAATAEISDNWLPSVEVVNAIDAQTATLRLIVLTHIMNTDEAAMAKIDQELVAGRAQMAQLRKKYEALISSPEEKKLYDEFAANWAKYIGVNDTALAHSRKNENDQAKAIAEGESAKFYAVSGDYLDKLIKLNHQGAEDARAASEHTYTTARNTLLVVAALVYDNLVLGTGVFVLGGILVLGLVITATILSVSFATSGAMASRTSALGLPPLRAR